MVFNPFTSFRKYQKFWMAAILLVSMVTFVLCTGVQGDFSDWVLSKFRKKQGPIFAKLDGESIYQQDMDLIRRQRNVANEFMRRSIEIVMNRADSIIGSQEQKQLGQREEIMKRRLIQIINLLKVRHARPRYFDGGVKFQEILDFIIWKKVADRLNIAINDATVADMIDKEVFAVVPGVGRLYDGIMAAHIRNDLRRENPWVTERTLLQALREEFRVRIAKLAAFEAQPMALVTRPMYKPEMVEELKYYKFKEEEEVRAPMSPAQIWDSYRENRTPYDVTMLPIRVERFLEKVPEPGQRELETFFETYRKTAYNPTSPTPGFEIPQRIKIEWITADPESPPYKGAAQLLSTLTMHPPVPWSEWPLVAACRAAVAPLAWDASMSRHYENVRKVEVTSVAYHDAPLTESALPALVSYFGKKKTTAQAVASAIAAETAMSPGAGLIAYRSHLYQHYRGEIAPLLEEEAKARVRLIANLAASGTGLLNAGLDSNSTMLARMVPQAMLAESQAATRFLPLAAVKDGLRERFELRLAESWAQRNMLIVKRELEQFAGQVEALKLHISELVATYGLTYGKTQEFYDRFNIGKAPELAPLREEFTRWYFQVNSARGTAKTERELKANDFYRLFFDSAEGRYQLQAWPPNVEIKREMSFLQSPKDAPQVAAFFDKAYERDGKAFLYWKVGEKLGRFPDSLDQVRDRVVQAWKLQKARALALPAAQAIALALEKSGGEFSPILAQEAKKIGTELIPVRGLAPIVRQSDEKFGLGGKYGEYPISQLGLEFPRNDMLKHLLALTRLTKPIASDYKELDEVNQKLFKEIQKLPEKERENKYAQVLTNQPQSVFYVAVVTGSPGPNIVDFATAYEFAAHHDNFAMALDPLLTRFQTDEAKRFEEELIQQLRRQMHLSDLADAKEQESFDATTS
jgi:hypothetical protein